MIFNQLKRLGASCDWSRERFTMDEGLSKAVLEVFVTLYKQGLIYKDKRLVNWDPKLLTAISDLEVEQVELNGHLWHFRYPVDGVALSIRKIPRPTSRSRRRGPKRCWAIRRSPSIRTTSATRHLVGKNVVLPIVGRKIPIVADEYSDPEKGTRRGQDHAGARLQRLRGRQAPQACRRSTS